MKKLLLLLPLILIAAGCNNTKQLTLYPVRCDDWLTRSPTYNARNFQNCHKPLALEIIAYKVGEQQVIKWYPNIEGSSFDKYTDCNIVDVDNWSCNGAAYSTFGFHDGVGFDSSSSQDIFVTQEQWSSINKGKSSEINANQQTAPQCTEFEHPIYDENGKQIWCGPNKAE